MFKYTVEDMRTGEMVFNSSKICNAIQITALLNASEIDKRFFVVPVKV